MFTTYVQRSDYRYDPKNITLKEFTYTNFNATNQTIDLQMKFNEPFDLGLNTEKSDYLTFFFNETYDFKTLLNITQDTKRRLREIPDD